MPFQIILAFINTAIYAFRQIGTTDAVRIQLKQKWAQMILRTSGFSLKIEGVPPQPGAQILVGNHISFLDIPVLMSAFPEVTFIAKEELRRWPIIGAGAAAVGTIFVNRSDANHRRGVRDKVAEVLKRTNRSVAIFPSGTTTLYEEVPWKKGAFEIAKQAQVPIQLFRIDYTPMRASAYVDDDNLLLCMAGLAKIKNKSVTLRWLEKFHQIDDPTVFSEKLRLLVAVPEALRNETIGN
jgi:1-acyl-sn-glycerol-3-phosphate acyltransferase